MPRPKRTFVKVIPQARSALIRGYQRGHDEWSTSRRYMSPESLTRTRLHDVPNTPGVTALGGDTLELAETAS